MRPLTQKLLLGYSTILTTLLATVVATDATSGASKAVFQEIDVQRINVREADGALRMVIHNASHQPGVYRKGIEHPHPGRKALPQAGMIFLNDEGTENGGLTFRGRRDAAGRLISSGGHLSFDQFEQDQVLALNHHEKPDGRREAGLTIIDRPEKPMPVDQTQDLVKAIPAQQKAIVERWVADGVVGNKTRLFLGKTLERASTLALSDAAGRTRMIVRVTADGAASIEFLDTTGKVVRRITPEGG